MPTPFWDDLYQNRLDWAERAYSHFISSIGEDDSSEFERRGEITVVLYGRTQVGKTTLLLKILGISKEQFDHVSHVLRGRRVLGKSATATAMRYGRSSDDCWRIDSVDSQPLDHEELESRLASIRENVESGVGGAREPVNIFIPSYCFSDDSSLLRVRVLDLPGTDASNKNERSHVRDVAERYVPSADLVLLVGKSDNLGFLQPSNLGLDELAMWQYAPERFRIVLTHTFSSQSTKEWILKEDEISVSSLRQYALEQIETHEYGLRDQQRFLECLYPVEFGKSWDGLRCSGDEVYGRVEPLVDKLFEMLSEDIKASATKYARIRSAFSLHAAIIEKGKREKIAVDEVLRLAKCNLDAIVSRLNDGNERLSGYRRLHSKYIKQRHDLLAAFKADVQLVEESISGLSGYFPFGAKSVSAIRQYISDSKIKLKADWRALAIGIELQDAKKDLESYPGRQVDKFFVGVERHLHGYKIDMYLSLDSYTRDLVAAENARCEASLFLRSYGAEILGGFKSRALRRIDYRIKKAEMAGRDIFSGLKLQLEDMQASLDRLDELDREARSRDEFYSMKVRRSRDFNRYLESSFQDAINENLAAIYNAKSSSEKFLILCLMSIIEGDLKKIRSGYEVF